jgi:rubredoxin
MKKSKAAAKNWWKCSSCGYTIQQAVPPEPCPGCKQNCVFSEVSCYTPECGGAGKIDPTLMSGGKR